MQVLQPTISWQKPKVRMESSQNVETPQTEKKTRKITGESCVVSKLFKLKH